MTEDRRFCPNCGSRNVEPDFRHTNVLGEMIADQNKWVCGECDYSGWMPAGEKENDAGEEIEFEQEEQPKIDTDFGTAYFRYFIYISAPFLAGFILGFLIFG